MNLSDIRNILAIDRQTCNSVNFDSIAFFKTFIYLTNKYIKVQLFKNVCGKRRHIFASSKTIFYSTELEIFLVCEEKRNHAKGI